ncbi:hypothetical protein N7533_008292 [Penicillium manginii]|jgi:hypothetical protein|uniref:uncharacterized protein n=1 Tax=Penicillium manginii TaxID=203109 RepID=UPI002547CB49|nr:uncharacterized protein N7533_008292 [Penicillium manginii]KAJ5751264.1 hypothetical protein N7533_008292 [Penicillium manginii]
MSVSANRAATRRSQQTISGGEKDIEPSLRPIQELFPSAVHFIQRRGHQAESHADIGPLLGSRSLLPPARAFGQSDWKQQALMQRDVSQRIASHLTSMLFLAVADHSVL